ncbi:MAG: PIN domain-containing protein [Deltaproteobacteria bacterium]|nr:PIN domain-containing protein [Deltaproteobacteria bacterium]
MNAKPFLDTNILIYAVAPEDHRSTIARDLIANGGIVSVQVLNEFVNVARRKLRRDWRQIEGALDLLRRLLDPPIPLTIDLHESAITLAREHRLAFYDALIVAAASRANCAVLFTEDMQDGKRMGTLTIRNPFLAA